MVFDTLKCAKNLSVSGTKIKLLAKMWIFCIWSPVNLIMYIFLHICLNGMFPFSTVAKNGDVCISILHEPGEDKFGYEKPEERWLPIHTVETIMISVISMLADPNSDSPANVDAAVSYTVYSV